MKVKWQKRVAGQSLFCLSLGCLWLDYLGESVGLRGRSEARSVAPSDSATVQCSGLYVLSIALHACVPVCAGFGCSVLSRPFDLTLYALACGSVAQPVMAPEARPTFHIACSHNSPCVRYVTHQVSSRLDTSTCARSDNAAVLKYAGRCGEGLAEVYPCVGNPSQCPRSTIFIPAYLDTHLATSKRRLSNTLQYDSTVLHHGDTSDPHSGQ